MRQSFPLLSRVPRSKPLSPLARSGPGDLRRWLWRVESEHQPARALRSRNPRQYGILSLSWALGSARCGKDVADGWESREIVFGSHSKQ